MRPRSRASRRSPKPRSGTAAACRGPPIVLGPARRAARPRARRRRPRDHARQRWTPSRAPTSAARASFVRCSAGSAAFPAEDRPRVGAMANPVREAARGRDRQAPGAAGRDRDRGAARHRADRRHAARPSVPARLAAPDPRDRAGDRAHLRPVRVRRLREPRGRDRRAELPAAEHPRGSPGPRPVGHDLRARPGTGGGGRVAERRARRGRTRAARGTCCGPTRRPARSASCAPADRRSGSSCPVAASATRPSTPATASSSSRWRASWSTRARRWRPCAACSTPFAHAMFGADRPTRFRPGYYPFTEPSVAFDIQCVVCNGTGCPACGRTGWMTILGAGMVHPGRAAQRRHRPRALPGLRVRDGHGPHHDAALRHPATSAHSCRTTCASWSGSDHARPDVLAARVRRCRPRAGGPGRAPDAARHGGQGRSSASAPTGTRSSSASCWRSARTPGRPSSP